MKNFFKRFFVFLTLPALAAGICFTFCGWQKVLPRGTAINGADVGGLTPRQAVQLVREAIISDLKGRELCICSREHVYSYSYPEISFKDNANAVARGIVRAGNYTVDASWYLNGLDAVVSAICAAEYRQLREPEAYFNAGEGEAFYYCEGQDGVSSDGDKLRRDILSSLQNRRYGGDFDKVDVSTETHKMKGDMAKLKQKTARLSAYTTYFDCGNSPRVSNIRLAGEKISGCVLAPGGRFSFNSRVGPRTMKNGFQRAKIIEDGRFVYGVGGGVCQVSTTLYNAALLAGLKVTEYHPHSLAVSYVSPSRDAMVSGSYSDMKFCNTTGCPVYIRVLTGLYYVRCEIYGLSDGAEYSLQSVVTGEEDGGVESECYLTSTRGGESHTRLIRRDKYLPAKKDGAAKESGQTAGSAA